jgi:hypothetical protein
MRKCLLPKSRNIFFSFSFFPDKLNFIFIRFELYFYLFNYSQTQAGERYGNIF